MDGERQRGGWGCIERGGLGWGRMGRRLGDGKSKLGIVLYR